MLKTIEHSSKFRNQVIQVFESMAKETPTLYKFLYEASIQCSVFFVGGFLRSVANNEKPRDLDVMFGLSHERLDEYIKDKKLATSINKFGGFKIRFNDVALDVWAAENNWAFQKNVVARGEKDIISGVAHGTFLNYDSLVFDLRTQKINVGAYNECVRSGTLDILRRSEIYTYSNPGKIGNVIRAFRIRQKTGLKFSIALCRYIFDQLNEYNLCEVDKAADYLLSTITHKSKDKNQQLENVVLLESMIRYVIKVLDEQYEKPQTQLELFA